MLSILSRSACSLFTSFVFVLVLCPKFITFMKKIQNGGQPIRNDGPESHFSKKGTPTMGGILIIASFIISSLLWCDISNKYIWPILFICVSTSVLGYMDDLVKVTKRSSSGISERQKLFWQILLGLLTVIWIINLHPASYALSIKLPFMQNMLYLGYFFIIFGIFVIVGSSNAVNLTDGLDGLVLGPTITSFTAFGILAYIISNTMYNSNILLPEARELSIICSAMIGSCLGFLWYNSYPASIMMGDVGSLSIGATVATIAITLKHEYVLAIVGGVFVIEALSVMIQVLYFKRTRKRIFLMAPIHHHFEKMGLHETKIVFRFWIVSILLFISIFIYNLISFRIF